VLNTNRKQNNLTLNHVKIKMHFFVVNRLLKNILNVILFDAKKVKMIGYEFHYIGIINNEFLAHTVTMYYSIYYSYFFID
jgi:hypothetical protein